MSLSNLFSPFMRLSFTKRITYGTVSIILFSTFIVYFFGTSTVSSSHLSISPVRGEFIVSITTTGELQAKNSIEIK